MCSSFLYVFVYIYISLDKRHNVSLSKLENICHVLMESTRIFDETLAHVLVSNTISHDHNDPLGTIFCHIVKPFYALKYNDL